jgi:hypothetical protein
MMVLINKTGTFRSSNKKMANPPELPLMGCDIHINIDAQKRKEKLPYQLRKRRHIDPKCRESPPPKKKGK